MELKEKLDLLTKVDKQESSINTEIKNLYKDVIEDINKQSYFDRVEKLIDKNNNSIELLSSIDCSDSDIEMLLKDIKETRVLLFKLKAIV